MKRLTLFLLTIALIASGQAFAQEADSTTQIDFETADGQVMPVFEIFVNPSEERKTSSLDKLTPIYFAPATAWVPNGLHTYVIEGSRLFVVDAQGNPQRWLLTGENKSLKDIGTIVGWVGLSIAVGGYVWGISQNFSDGIPHETKPDIFTLLVLGGLASWASGNFMTVLALPQATRRE